LPGRHHIAPLALLAALLLLGACRSEQPSADYVARVGNTVLTAEDLSDALGAMPPGMDPATAREQYIEQWLTNQLLAEEARRRGLVDDPDVQRQLQDNERNVLSAALLSELYRTDGATVNRADLETYFERNRARLRLREPFVRVRYLETASRDSAEAARGELQRIMRVGGNAASRDSLFVLAARRFTADTTAALALAQSYVPQSRLTRQAYGGPWGIVAQMGAAEISPVIAAEDSTFYVIQLVERIPAGEEPELEWVADEIRRRVAIQNRQLLVAREVQRLRTEAEARGDLRVRDR
jgi:hypothetical protein